MKRIIKFKTLDEKEFPSIKEAREYSDKRYTEIICRLSSKIASLGKYQEIKEYIDANLEEFEKALAIKRDCQIDGIDAN